LENKLRGKTTLKLIIAEATAFGVNVVPLALWFFEDYAVETIVILYALESLVSIILAVLTVLLLTPRNEQSASNKILVRKEMIKNFLLVAGMKTLVIYVLVEIFIFLLGRGAGIELSNLKFGLLCIAAFQVFDFLSCLLLLRPLSLEKGELLLSANFVGIDVLILSIIIGVFVGAFFNVSIFISFIVLKTIIDIAAPVQFFTGKTYDSPVFTVKTSIGNRNRF
jgi:hypothetical protein